MSSLALTLAAAEEAHASALPLPAWVFGVIVLGIFLLLLLFTWMFRHTAQAFIEDRRGTGYGPHGHGQHGRQGQHGQHGQADRH